MNNPETDPRRSPQFIDEAEALVGMSAFYDDERSDLLYDDPPALDPSEIGARAVLYTGALRIIATERNWDRTVQKATDAKTFNDNWRITSQRLAEIALKNSDALEGLVVNSAFINNAERYLENIREDEELRADQQELMLKILEFIQSAPLPVKVRNSEGKEETRFVKGVTIVAPTGYGKTVLMARAAMALGGGWRFESQRLPRKPKILIVVPTQELVEQVAGITGDNTFGRFAEGLTVGGYYQFSDELDTDVVVTTRAKFINEFRDGALAGQKIDAIMVDEAHELTSKKFLKIFNEHWRGVTFGFTATPAYNETKDVRHILPHTIRQGDMLEYAGTILNGMQLFSFVADKEEYHRRLRLNSEGKRPAAIMQEILDETTIAFVQQQVAEGRRGMIFCMCGGKSWHARQLAEQLSTLEVNGRKIVAEAIGVFRTDTQRDNKAVLEDYHNGTIDVLCSSGKGSQGLNAAVDFVALNRSSFSKLRLQQMLGRGSRPSERFGVTRYVEFLSPYVDHDQVTIWQALGLERVEQGVTIVDGHWGSVKETVWNAPIVREAAARVHSRLVSELLLGEKREIEIPSHYIPLSTVLEGHDLDESWAIRRLRRAGLKSISRYELVDGSKKLIYYYEPGARTYFAENPQVLRVLHEYEGGVLSVLKAGPHDKLVRVAAEELGVSIAYILYTMKRQGKRPRYMQVYEGTRILPHITAEEFQMVERIFHECAYALPTEKTWADLEREHGIRPKTMKPTEEEIALSNLRRSKGYKRPLRYWSDESAEGIRKRMQEHNRRRAGLSADVLSHQGAAQIVNLTPRMMYIRLKEQYQPIFFKLTNAPQMACFTWSQIQTLYGRYGPKPGGVFVDFTELPSEEEMKDISDPRVQAKIAYAQSIQRRLMPGIPLLSYDKED